MSHILTTTVTIEVGKMFSVIYELRLKKPVTMKHKAQHTQILGC